MIAILLAWRNSLELLRPHRLSSIGSSSFHIFIKTACTFARYFSPFLLCNAILFLLFGAYTTNVITNPTQYPPGMLFWVIIFAESIAWFLASTAFLLLLRKEEPAPPHQYYAAFILKYCQLTLALTAVLFLVTGLLMQANISTLPSISWYCLVPVKALELLIVYYWLDAKQISFRHMLGAIEHGINAFFYNLPIIGLLALLAIGIDLGWSSLINYLLDINIAHALFANTQVLLAPLSSTLQGRAIIVALKYSTFMIEITLATLLLSVYRRKRHEQYSDSLFL